MASHPTLIAVLGTLAMALGACTPAEKVTEEPPPDAVYEGASIIRLDDGLISFSVAMRNAGDEAAVDAYGRCVAAQYALEHGYGFLRQVRTIVRKEGSEWFGDAIYLVSPSLPPGLRNVDAEVVVGRCAELGIPTI